jgi:P4 family phage/plasmid primase-like protien
MSPYKRRRIKREAKINDPVVIPESLIQKLKAYGPHFIKLAHAVLGDPKSGKKAIEKAWQDNPYEAEELQEWTKAGNNYGVMAGELVGIIDADTKEVQDILEAAKINTFTVKTGRTSGEGRHIYFLTNASENGIIFDKDDTTQIGNLQIENKYVVGPGCHHGSGGVYQIINDIPLVRILKKDLERIFGKQLQWSGEIREKNTEEAEEERILTGKQVALTTLLDQPSSLYQRGNELQGPHPIHGSTTGSNFCVNAKENVWHCFRCNSGGGWLSWIAVKHGLIQCHEAHKGALRGVKFIEALKIAKEKYGIEVVVPDEDISPDVEHFFEEDKDGNLKFMPALVVKELMKESVYLTRIDDGSVFKYNPTRGIYEEIFDISIGGLIAKKLGKHWSINRDREIIGLLKRRTVRKLQGLEGGFVAVTNGILNIYTRELKPFSPDIFVINALSVKHDVHADCPKYKIFLIDIVPPEPDRQSLQQFLGYMFSANCKYGKSLMLVGIGANGKSTLLKIWVVLLGDKNVSNIPLQAFSSRFRKACLYGKMANIDEELSAEALKETETFKLLVTGQKVDGEEKFKPPFDFPNIAKLLFACNTVPKTPDESDAFFRRWIIIMFPNQFLEDNPKTNPNIAQELITPEELSGILNWALDGLAALEKAGRFTISKTMKEIKQQYIYLSNTVKAFTDAKLEMSFEDESLRKNEVYETYLKFCEIWKLPFVSKKAFAEELPQHIGATASETKRDGEHVKLWRGIKFKIAENDD